VIGPSDNAVPGPAVALVGPGNTIIETRPMKPGVYLRRSLLSPEHCDRHVSIVNTTARGQGVGPSLSVGGLGFYMMLTCCQAGTVL